ncbi:hypothetical protein [Streptomyces sp. NPDC004533]|uniref:hypothetical protein n=1 Tax=Streptomyces sp. NPDC004533 TaxID=3154278 RepID=UPI0033B1CCDE
MDTKRHRAAVLAYRSSDRAGFVLPVDTATGAQGTPLQIEERTKALPSHLVVYFTLTMWLFTHLG